MSLLFCAPGSASLFASTKREKKNDPDPGHWILVCGGRTLYLISGQLPDTNVQPETDFDDWPDMKKWPVFRQSLYIYLPGLPGSILVAPLVVLIQGTLHAEHRLVLVNHVQCTLYSGFGSEHSLKSAMAHIVFKSKKTLLTNCLIFFQNIFVLGFWCKKSRKMPGKQIIYQLLLKYLFIVGRNQSISYRVRNSSSLPDPSPSLPLFPVPSPRRSTHSPPIRVS